MRTEADAASPFSEITDTSVVPPPKFTIICPLGSVTSMPAPMAAATVSGTRVTRRAPAVTTASMNAFVGPGTGDYLAKLTDALKDKGIRSDLLVMRSNGGVASVTEAAERPVTLMLSGPAAGVLGAQWAGRLVDRERLITFDMGGTSADIGLVTEDGVNVASARDTHIADHPLLVPMFDIETIGAGGGSIAHLDSAGAFKVGPRSAGAVPGPHGAVLVEAWLPAGSLQQR